MSAYAFGFLLFLVSPLAQAFLIVNLTHMELLRVTRPFKKLLPFGMNPLVWINIELVSVLLNTGLLPGSALYRAASVAINTLNLNIQD